MAWRIVVLRLGWAAKVVATVLGDIGGSGLLTSLTGRGMQFSVNETFDGLVEAFEHVWMGWRDWLDARKLK